MVQARACLPKMAIPILASASYLRLYLLCTYRTPVAEMLAHSPPLPLIIDYFDEYDDITTEDEEGILLALEHRDRVHSIRLRMPFQSPKKLTNAVDDEFAILECLVIVPLIDTNLSLALPKTFQAPHLRHLLLSNFALPIGSPLLTTAQTVNLISFVPEDILPSAYFHPNDLLQLLLHIPRLEMLSIHFESPVPNRDVEKQLLQSPVITTHIILPNLRIFAFGGTSAYLAALLPRMTTPLLETLQIKFVDEVSFPLPHLQHFISTIENLRFSRATLTFIEHIISLSVYPHEVARVASEMEFDCGLWGLPVASAAQMINSFRLSFSSVEELTLKYINNIYVSLEWTYGADRSQWRKLLRPFSNLKKLQVPWDLIRAVSCSLEAEDGESPMGILPELKELSYSGCRDDRGAFTKFIDSRQTTGHPVALIKK